MHIRKKLLHMIGEGYSQHDMQVELLVNTVTYYFQDISRKCTSSGSRCSYSPRDVNLEGISEGCAVGRLLTNEEQDKLEEVNYLSVDTRIVKYLGVDSNRIIHAIGVEFLTNLQILHDAITHPLFESDRHIKMLYIKWSICMGEYTALKDLDKDLPSRMEHNKLNNPEFAKVADDAIEILIKLLVI